MVVRGLYALAFVLLLLVAFFAFRLSQSYAELENMPGVVSFGASAEQADVRLLAFVDYTSSYSQDAHAPLMQAVQDDGKTRVTFFPLPQGSPTSIRAAKLILAASAQGKGVAMHETLMRTRRPLTDEIVSELAESLGIDTARLQDDLRSRALSERLMAIVGAAHDVRVKVTPSVIANRRVLLRPVEDPLGLADFVQLIKEARS